MTPKSRHKQLLNDEEKNKISIIRPLDETENDASIVMELAREILAEA